MGIWNARLRRRSLPYITPRQRRDEILKQTSSFYYAALTVGAGSSYISWKRYPRPHPLISLRDPFVYFLI